MMKKLIYLLPVMAMLSFYGCGGSSTDATQTYTVTLEASPGQAGTVSGGDTYEEGTSASIKATPNEGWRFDHWEGDYEGTSSSATISVDADKNIKAVFEKKDYELTINTTGQGNVDEQVVTAKAKNYAHGTKVQLTAKPDTGWAFVKWKGDLSGTDNPQQITVESSKDVTAIFEKKEYALTITTQGQGAVDEQVVKPKDYEAGTTVELTANPANGWKFEEWQGDVTGTDNPVQLTIDEAKEVTVVFKEQNNNLFYLADNGVTIKCPEAAVGDSGTVNGILYTKVDKNTLDIEKAATSCVSGITDMEKLFYYKSSFNEDISSWDVSSVTNMTRMFMKASSFNQDIGAWDVSSVENMHAMFQDATSFDQDIDDWDVGSVENMNGVFRHASSFNQDIGSWDVSSTKITGGMFSSAYAFNQDIGNWDVSKVENMSGMFQDARAFNHDIGSWDVSQVKDMGVMFQRTKVFNQDLNDWDVGEVTDMSYMFDRAEAFNGPIGEWDVSKVRTMNEMFNGAIFNGDIGDWDVGSLESAEFMFRGDTLFNQDISNWDVSSLRSAIYMFYGAKHFNQNIGGWDVSNVERMRYMFMGAENFNQDLSGWCVKNITDEPVGFADDPSGIIKPVWGTCPGGD